MRRRDRLFWILLAQMWSDWRGALVIVEPATVVRWHRDWVRRRWHRLSARGRTASDGGVDGAANDRGISRRHGTTVRVLALDKDAPIPRPAQDVSDGDIVALPEVGGLHHRYERRAA